MTGWMTFLDWPVSPTRYVFFVHELSSVHMFSNGYTMYYNHGSIPIVMRRLEDVYH